MSKLRVTFLVKLAGGERLTFGSYEVGPKVSMVQLRDGSLEVRVPDETHLFAAGQWVQATTQYYQFEVSE